MDVHACIEEGLVMIVLVLQASKVHQLEATSPPS